MATLRFALAAYKAALDMGMSREQAASIAKNLTVNFNRKGQVGQQAGAVYAFFNAAMQGTARIGQTLFDMDGGDISTLRLSKTGKAVADIEKLTVWGNHSPTMYADYRFATINGESVAKMINDQEWNANTFLPTVGKRGAAIIEARGLSSAASAANAAIDHMRDWALGTNGKWVTMGIPSNGEYGIPKDVMFGFPVTCENGEYKIVEGLEIDAFSQERINITLAELQGEQDGVKHLL